MTNPPVQFSVDRYLERTWIEFQLKTFPIDSLRILWRSFDSFENLADNYLAATGQQYLHDPEKELTSQQQDQRREIDEYSKIIWKYREWARKDGGDPLFREEIVRYCSAFENALKRVAFAYAVTNEFGGAPIFVGVGDIKRLKKFVGKSWDGFQGRIPAFYVDNIVNANPDKGRWSWPMPDEFADEDICAQAPLWKILSEAFLLRNRILHQDGFTLDLLDFDEIKFEPVSEVDVTMKLVRDVHRSMVRLMEPLEAGLQSN